MGWSDVPLNQTGIDQAKKLSKDLQAVRLEVIYSSPLSRTLETAKIVAEPNKVEIIQDGALNERNNGILEGTIPKLEFPDIYHKKTTDPDFVIPGGGESINQHKRRVLDFMENITKISGANIIGISTSNGVAMSILEEYFDKELPTMNMPNSSYYSLDYDGQKLTLKEMPNWLVARYTG